MTGALIYIAVGLMVLTVLSNRYWRRQLALTRVAMSKLKVKVDDITKEVAEVASEYAQLAHSHAEMERKVAKADTELQAATQELEAKQAAPLERYYVFDRMEPRPGRFWEVAVRCAPAGGSAGDRGWLGVRRYLLISEAEREVRERVGMRFPRRFGFEIVEVVPCRLNGLTVNRIAELSTFRKPGKDEDDDGSARQARRPARRTAET